MVRPIAPCPPIPPRPNNPTNIVESLGVDVVKAYTYQGLTYKDKVSLIDYIIDSHIRHFNDEAVSDETIIETLKELVANLKTTLELWKEL
jgi:hypothetical protein